MGWLGATSTEMKRGTLSLLFGVHQFLWHPVVVGRAWRMLYGRWPGLYEWIAIVTHDLGYWGLPNMDGEEGKRHPERSQSLACVIAGNVATIGAWNRYFTGWVQRGYISSRVVEVGLLVRHHSREMVRLDRREFYKTGMGGLCDPAEPSMLCWPDKLSIVFEPEWFYLFRARLTGELDEFKQNAIDGGFLPPVATGRDWFRWYRARVVNLPEIQRILGA